MKHFLVLALLLASSGVFALTNVRLNAIQAIGKTWSIDADYKLRKRWTLGPMLRYMDAEAGGYDVTVYEAGVRANYYFQKEVFKTGWYAGPYLTAIHTKVVDTNTFAGELKGDKTGVHAGSMFGHHWVWKEFNLMIGTGPELYSIGNLEVENSSGSKKDDYNEYEGLQLALEVQLGWLF